MWGGNVKTALAALRSAKWRSVLTMFGIVIGIVSVVTTVSLGEGVKQQIVGQINVLGKDLLTVRPGKIVERDSSGKITRVNLSSNLGFGSGSLSDQDVQAIQQVESVKLSSPLGFISTPARSDSNQLDGSFVLGVSHDYPTLIQQKLEFGNFFSEGESQRHVAVIGKRVAEKLFQENAPIGMTLKIRGEEYVVRGVFEEFAPNILNANNDFNKAVFIPYPTAKQLAGGNLQIVEVLARPRDPSQVDHVLGSINQSLSNLRGGDSDFTILKQDENLSVTSNILNLLTGLIAGVAAISLLVGGIGIMNIMLVSVSERTKEIGIRKAIGATNRQILAQFLTEATVLSVCGAIIGIALSFICNYLIRITTDIKPVINWQIVLIATGVSLAVGIIFGLTPAYKAARKDPIDALRYE